jgi:ABC-type uncharacterized transport system substrate-binding protein
VTITIPSHLRVTTAFLVQLKPAHLPRGFPLDSARSLAVNKAMACRIFVVLVAVTLSYFSSAEAQQGGKIPLVGMLFIGGREQPHLEAFKQGLRERGHLEGQNIALEYRYAEGRLDRLDSLAAELVQLKPDVIVTTSGNSARAVTQATKTIPIVLTTVADP